MDIAGHVSRQMLSRYSHIRMEAKRKALDGIGTKSAATPATKESDSGTEAGTIEELEVPRAQKWPQ